MPTDYEILLARRTLRGLTPPQALLATALLIDGAYSQKDLAGNEKALEWCKQLRKKKWWKQLTNGEKGEVDYIESNAWGDREGLTQRGKPEEWKWAQEEITRQILCLRSAMKPEKFEAQLKKRQCEILTNLANALNRIGRTVEAVEYWSRAIRIDSSFGMALGNRAIGLYTYATLIYDPGHQVILLQSCREDISKALLQDVDADSQSSFTALQDNVCKHLEAMDSGEKVQWDEFPLGESEEERTYRDWCLAHRLFLNPLNDIRAQPLAARDVLSLPSLTTSVGSGIPSHIGLFNNLKQELATARYLCFKGIHQHRPHFSDREVHLVNTLDYPSYGIGCELVKASYRMAYSILDKVGFMVNEYFSFGIMPRSVSFRKMWFEGQEVNNDFLACVRQRQNLPLRGLYWMSRDLFDNRDGFNASAEPEALELQQIRNHIEHRYLKVHGDMWASSGQEDSFTDKLAVSISREELEAKAIRMLKFARSALIYLVCAVQVEELAQSAQAENGLVAPMPLSPWEDSWKV